MIVRARALALALSTIGLAGLTLASPAQAQFKQKITHDASRCNGGGPAVLVQIGGIKPGGGTLRVQSYRGVESDWLKSGRWINRVELPARAGTMRVCMPVPAAGTYGIAVRHDLNNNGETDLSTDGGAMSGNPSINIWNLGKPSYKKTAFRAGPGVTRISITMRYR